MGIDVIHAENSKNKFVFYQSVHKHLVFVQIPVVFIAEQPVRSHLGETIYLKSHIRPMPVASRQCYKGRNIAGEHPTFSTWSHHCLCVCVVCWSRQGAAAKTTFQGRFLGTEAEGKTILNIFSSSLNTLEKQNQKYFFQASSRAFAQEVIVAQKRERRLTMHFWIHLCCFCSNGH